MKDYLVICATDEDQKLAERLKMDLLGVGLRVFSEAGLTATEGRNKVNLSEAIKHATGFICIASRQSVSSSMIKMELKAAFRAGLSIVMFAIDEIGYSAMQKLNGPIGKIDCRHSYKQALGEIVTYITGPEEVEDSDDRDELVPGEYVFLSYAEADTPYMQQVKDFLSEKGYRYWEFQGSTRDYQTNLALDLEGILKNAAATLTILSPAWKQSDWSMKEFMYSQQVGKATFLLRFEDVEPTLAIADILYIDFVEDKSRGFQRLDDELKTLFPEK